MQKEEFAKKLRKRQIEYGIVPEYIVNGLSDEEIIDSYRICSNCGEPFFDIEDLDAALKETDDVDEILDIAESLKRSRGTAHTHN